jgi:hypothetical protein
MLCCGVAYALGSAAADKALSVMAVKQQLLLQQQPQLWQVIAASCMQKSCCQVGVCNSAAAAGQLRSVQ